MSPLDSAPSPLAPANDINSSPLARIKGMEDKIDKMADEGQKEIASVRSSVDALKPPKLDALPPLQQTPQTGAVKSFGSFAGLLAVFGGMLTRHPLTASLNAAAGVITAVKNKDMAAAQHQYDIWKVNTDNALKLQNFKMQTYEAILDQKNVDERTIVAQITARARAMGDEIMALHAINDGVQGAERVQIDNKKLADQVEANQGKIEEAKIKIDAFRAWRQKNPNATPDEIIKKAAETFNPAAAATAERNQYSAPQELAVKGPDGKTTNIMGQQDKATGAWVTADQARTSIQNVERVIKGSEPPPGDKSVDETAKLIAHYQMAPLSAFALRSQFGQAVMARVSEINPNYNGTLYGQRAKAVRDFGTGQQGNVIRSMNVSIAHLGTFEKLATALRNGNVQSVNSIANKIVEETGGPSPTNFDTAKQIIGQEITKAIIGGGGGVTERQEMAEKLQSAESPAQLEGVIQTAKALLAGQLQGLRRQYEQATGLKNFDDLLSDEAKRELTKTGDKNTPGQKIPVPPTHAGDPDGTEYDGSNGSVYVKQGGFMVPK